MSYVSNLAVFTGYQANGKAPHYVKFASYIYKGYVTILKIITKHTNTNILFFNKISCSYWCEFRKLGNTYNVSQMSGNFEIYGHIQFFCSH